MNVKDKVTPVSRVGFSIRRWAETDTVELIWERGEGDDRLRGFRSRDTGKRAIETNGDPIWEDSEGFETAWEEQSLWAETE
jgi:hypothetical protein